MKPTKKRTIRLITAGLLGALLGALLLSTTALLTAAVTAPETEPTRKGCGSAMPAPLALIPCALLLWKRKLHF